MSERIGSTPCELRIGLTLRELQVWIDTLKHPPRGMRLKVTVERVAGEIERAVAAARRAGITNA